MTDQDNNNLPPKGTFAYLRKATSARKPPKGTADDLPKERTNARAHERSNARTNARANQRTPERRGARANEHPPDITVYVIEVPHERQRQRSTFNVFRDQYEALKKLQQAAADAGEKRPELGHMVQEAIDLYLARRAKQLPNVRLRKTGPT